MRHIFYWMVAVGITLFSIEAAAHFPDLTEAQNQVAQQLHNRAGVNCCSAADGASIKDADWGVSGGLFWVFIDGKRRIVPSEAVVEGPNPYNSALVWHTYYNGEPLVKCFQPGHLS